MKRKIKFFSIKDGVIESIIESCIPDNGESGLIISEQRVNSRGKGAEILKLKVVKLHEKYLSIDLCRDFFREIRCKNGRVLWLIENNFAEDDHGGGGAA